MLVKKVQTGFTLIEITIVMSIAALFATILLLGQGQVRQRAQFTDAMERIKSDVVRVKNETDTSVNITATAVPNSKVTFWGKRIKFNTNDITIDTLIFVDAGAAVPAGAVCGPLPSVCTVTADTSVQPFKWGIQMDPVSANQEVIFVRGQTSGQLQTFAAPTSFAFQNPAAYVLSGGPPVQAPITVQYLDPNNPSLRAYIAIDPASQVIKLVYS